MATPRSSGNNDSLEMLAAALADAGYASMRYDKRSIGASAANETILSSLEKGQVVSDVPPLLASVYRPRVQPYLISWFHYVPADEFKKLRVPCLILQGDADIQAPVTEAEALKAAKPNAELQIIRGMNHVLKLVPAQQMASYGNPRCV